MEVLEFICIGCPMGCPLRVEMDEKEILSVTGNTCKRGEIYAKKEALHPTRIVTSTVLVQEGNKPVVSVKTKEDIPKEKIMGCMEILKKKSVHAPVAMGDVIVKNVADTGVDVVATGSVGKR